MSKGEIAVSIHAQGFNCAQCVLKANEEKCSIDDSTATKITEGFGGGVRCGEICGAISGGVMALGLCGAKAADVKKFTSAFKDKYGCVRCLDLKTKGIACDDLIEFSADLTDKTIKELENTNGNL